MTTTEIANILNRDTLRKIFPPERSDQFFDALFGDASEGSYDIELGFRNATDNRLTLELVLHERPGCCLACNLTHGLPQVFSKHPIINISGVVQEIGSLVINGKSCDSWSLSHTEQRSRSQHVIPLVIELSDN